MAGAITVEELESFGASPQALDQFNDLQKEFHVSAATDEAYSYLAKVISTPLDPVPDAVKVHIARMAAYSLLSMRGIDLDGPDRVVYENYKLALEYFKQAAKEGLVVGGSTGPQPPVDETGLVDNLASFWSEGDRGWWR